MEELLALDLDGMCAFCVIVFIPIDLLFALEIRRVADLSTGRVNTGDISSRKGREVAAASSSSSSSSKPSTKLRGLFDPRRRDRLVCCHSGISYRELAFLSSSGFLD